MTRKLFAMLLVACMVVGLLGGCAPSAAPAAEAPAAEAAPAAAPAAEPAAEPAAAEAPAEPITLNVLWATENNWNGFEDFIKMYEEKTGNTVDVQFYPATEYSTIITTKMMAGEGPDIFRSDGINLEGQWPDEWFADLSGEEWISRLTEGGKTNLTWSNGLITQAPTAPLGPIGIAYNKDTLAAAGVTELPKTWTEFLDACAKIKAAGFIPVNLQLASGNEFGATQMYKTGWASINYTRGTAWVAQMVQDVKHNKVKFADVPELKQVLDQILELQSLGYLNEDYMATTMEMTSARLGSGECGFTTAGEWALPALVADYPDANIGVMPLPVGDDQGCIIVSPGIGMAANAGSEKLDAAKEFIAMWCSQEWQAEYVKLNPGTPWFTDVESEGNKFTADTTKWLGENRAYPTFNGPMGVFPEMESRPLMQELMLGNLDSEGYLKALDDAAEIIAVGNGVEGW